MDENKNNLQSTEDSLQQPTIKPSVLDKNKKLLICIAIIILLLVPLICLLLLHTHHRQNKQIHPKTPIKMTISRATSNLYTDNWHEFTIAIPKDWQVSHSMQQGTTGLNTKHPQTHLTEVTQFYVPGQTGVTIQVEQGQPTCPFTQPLTTSLAGFPASYDSAMHTWTIPTTKATIQVSLAYPGSGGFNPPMRITAPTKIPQTVVNEDQELLNKILKTFKSNNLQPFHC